MNVCRESERSWSGGGAAWRGVAGESSAASRPTAGRGLVVVVRSSRRVRLVAGIALVVVCAMAVPLLAARASAKPVRVLAAARDLVAGTVLTGADLVPVSASAPSGAVVPAGGLAGLVGRTLRVEVPAGALLDAADLGVFPPVGTSVVPVSVKAGRYPADLATGQQVAVFPVAGQGAGVPTVPAVHAAATGVVVQIAPVANDPSGTVVIDLQVPLGAASVVAQASGVVLVGLDAQADAP